MKKSLNELRDEAYRVSREHGFYEAGPPNFGERLALIHSEVSEALEDYRAGKPIDFVWYERPGFSVQRIVDMPSNDDGTLNKPCGIPSEMADVIIRVLDFCGANGIDIEKVVAEKMAYNESRPYKHGKKC